MSQLRLSDIWPLVRFIDALAWWIVANFAVSVVVSIVGIFRTKRP
jgi:hypothetical protein